MPTMEGLAEYLDVSTDTLYEWGKRHKEFSVAVKKVAERQRKQLMDDGMYGGKEVNAAMAIFLLKANHGMSDGSQTLHQTNIGKVYIELPRRLKKENDLEALAETTTSS